MVHFRKVTVAAGPKRPFGQCDYIDLFHPQSGLSQAELDRMNREAPLMLVPAEALFLGGSNQHSVADYCSRGVVRTQRVTQDVHAFLRDGLRLLGACAYRPTRYYSHVTAVFSYVGNR
jgi:hypothetical protein